VNVRVQESLSGIRLMKSFVQTDYEKARFAGANDGFMERNVLASRVVALIHPSTQTLTYLGIAAVLWFGGIDVVQGGLPVGRVLAFLSYLTQLLFALIMTSNLLMQFSRAQASIDRIREILDAHPAIDDPVADAQADVDADVDAAAEPDSPAGAVGEAGAVGAAIPAAARTIRGEVEFREVSFSYNAEPVLTDVSLRIEPGETVVIMGETGSGKSTLVSLIPRLYDVTAGQVFVDGIDVREYDLDTLRAAIGMAPQQVVLFSGSVRENITYGLRTAAGNGGSDGTAPAEVARRAAQVAAIAPFVESLPDAYETDVRRGGVNLSGGQKQRLSIARALAPSPAIRIFDDATSAVDLTTELAILERLTSQDEESTTILVAQRITTAMRADKVIVLEEGRVSGVGTHGRLMETNGIYAEIYRSQFGHRGNGDRRDGA